jgi:hypothetical protein
MKILVERKIIEDMYRKVSWMANQKSPYKPGDGSDFDEVHESLELILAAANKYPSNSISVESKKLYDVYDVLNSMKASQSNVIRIAKDMVSDMLPLPEPKACLWNAELDDTVQKLRQAARDAKEDNKTNISVKVDVDAREAINTLNTLVNLLIDTRSHVILLKETLK